MLCLFIRIACLSVLVLAIGSAQPWKVYRATRVAGNQPKFIGVPPLEANLPPIFALGHGPNQDLYFSGANFGMLRLTGAGMIQATGPSNFATAFSFAPDGGLYGLAGNSLFYTNPDGVTRTISLTGPWGRAQLPVDVAATSDGRAYVADQRGRRIFLVDRQGGVSVVAGLGGLAPLSGEPYRIAVDSSNRLYVSYTSGSVVRVVQAEVITLASFPGLLGDIAVTKSEDVYYVARGPAGVYRVRAGQSPVEVLAGVAPASISVDAQDRLVYLSVNGRMILRREADGTITRLAGTEAASIPGGEAYLPSPRGIVLGAGEDLYVSDGSAGKIVKLRRRGQVSAEFVEEVQASIAANLLVRDSNGTIYFPSGNGREVFRYRDGEAPVLHASGLQNIVGLGLRDGQVLVADRSLRSISVVTTSGAIEPLPIQASNLGAMVNMITGPDGQIVFLDGTGSFFRVNRENQVTRLDRNRYGDDGAKQNCGFRDGVAPMAIDGLGSLIFGTGSAVCRLDATGKVWLVAGQLLADGPAEEGATGAEIRFRTVGGLVVDESGAIYVSDTGNEMVRKLELIEDGAPFALQPEVAAVRGAGGSTAGPVVSMSPGGLISIFGSQFAPPETARAVTAADLVEGRLPTMLASTCVRIGEQLAPLTFVGANQINAQVPNLAFGNATVSVVANCDGTETFSAASLQVASLPSTPEFLYWVNRGSGNNPVVAVEATSGNFIGPANLISGVTFRPAKSGELLTIYAVGFGATDPNPEAGASVSSAAPTKEAAIVYVGGNPLPAANVLYTGASPGIAGLYQVNLRLPTLPNGEQKIRIQIGSNSSPTDGYLLVQN